MASIVMGSSSASSWTLSVSANTFTQPTTTNISSNIQLHETAQLQVNSARGGTGGIGTINLSGIISNTTGKTTSGQIKYLGGSAAKNFFNVTGANTYTGNTLISQAVVTFNSLADDGTASALGRSGFINVTENTSFSTLIYNGTTASTTNRRLTIGLALAGNAGASNITNNATNAAHTLSFTGTTSVINGGSGNRSLVLNGSNTGNNTFAQSIDNATSGVTTFAKQNAGRWILTNANSNYTGASTLAGGFLHVMKLSDGGTTSSIGAATNAAANLVFNGGELTYIGTGDSTDRLMSFAAGGNISNNGSGPLNFTNTGVITHSGSLARSINLGGSNNADTNIFSPQIVDGSGTAITSISSRGGKWTLANTNTFTGGIVFGTTSTTGGTLNFNDDSALGASTGAITFTGSGNLVALQGSTLGSARTISVASGKMASFGIISASGSVVVVNSKITGSGGVTRVSGSAFTTGTIRHANDASDYTGSFDTRFGITEFTSVANGGSPSSLGAGSVINANNSSSAAVLRYVGGANSSTNRPINWSASTGALYLENSGSGTVSYLDTTPIVTEDGNKSLILGGTNTGDNTLAQPVGDGPASGVVAVQKTGAGKWILSGSNTYTGNTTVNGGTLSLGTATLADASAISVAGGASLELNHASTDTVKELYFNGVQQAVGTYNAANSSGYITGTGSLLVTSGPAPSSTYATWIAGFSGAAGAPGFNQDADGDGVTNGVEHILGTDPSVSSSGLVQVSSTGTSVKFRHTLTNDLASDVTRTYQWSTDLANWYASGATNAGGTTATISSATVTDNAAPANDVVEVTVTITAGLSNKIFARLAAAQP